MNQSATLTPTVEAGKSASTMLSAKDRCDAGVNGTPCGAQAWVKVIFSNGGILLFCGHHYHGLASHFAASGAAVEDYTDKIPS